MSFSDWMGALGQVLLVVVVSFIVLCALTSFIRFRLMSEQAMESEELGSSEERDFRLVVINQIAKARRARKPISVVLLQLPEEGATVAEVEAHLKPLLRDRDIVIACGSKLIGIMLLCGSDNADTPVNRIMEKSRAVGLAGIDNWRFGVAGYPDHGFKTSVLYSRALEMIQEAAASEQCIAGMATKEEVIDSAAKTPAGALDQLTGLISEEKMLGIMRRFIAQERRQDLPVSMAYMEVDQPERLINQYGKKSMDQMIKELAGFLDKNIRETDIIARFGETGFVIALSARPAASARLAQRIIEEVRRMAFNAGSGMKTSLSAGIAGYPDVIGTVVQYFVAAEAALRVARSRGRNQCVVYDKNIQMQAEDEESPEKI